MKWLKGNRFLFIVLLLIILVTVPIFFNYVIFDNSFLSNVSNDGWAGFFGGYLGAIIGAFATICAVILEINYNQKQREKDEIKNIRPYLCVELVYWCKNNEVTTKVKFSVQNVGFHAACDIAIYDADMDDVHHELLYDKHTTLGANNKVCIELNLDLNKSELYSFHYFDIRGNMYTQELRFSTYEEKNVKHVNYCDTLEPELYKTKEERMI